MAEVSARACFSWKRLDPWPRGVRRRHRRPTACNAPATSSNCTYQTRISGKIRGPSRSTPNWLAAPWGMWWGWRTGEKRWTRARRSTGAAIHARDGFSVFSRCWVGDAGTGDSGERRSTHGQRRGAAATAVGWALPPPSSSTSGRHRRGFCTLSLLWRQNGDDDMVVRFGLVGGKTVLSALLISFLLYFGRFLLACLQRGLPFYCQRGRKKIIWGRRFGGRIHVCSVLTLHLV